MRLIDADKIFFEDLGDDTDKAKAQIIIERQPTINQEFFGFTNRLVLAKCFEEWAKENSVLNCPQSVVSWLHTMGFLYVNKANEYAVQNKQILENKND